MYSDHIAKYKQLQEEAQAIEANWLAPTGRILNICIRPADGDAPGLHVSCVSLGGEEVLAIDLPMHATLSEFESTIKDNLKWAGIDIVSTVANESIAEESVAAREQTNMAPINESIAARGETSFAQKFICRCWKRGVHSEAPESDTVADSKAIADSSLCRFYEEITVKELATPECIGRNYSNGHIDTRTCRRCGGNDITTQRFTEWCQMNGDAGGQNVSICRTCGLYLMASWSDD